MYQIKKTTRKFYNKWLYKVTVRAPGSAVFRMEDIDKLPVYLKNLGNNPSTVSRISYLHRAVHNQDDLIKLAEFLVTLNKDSYCTRIEQDYIDVYLNERSIFDDMCAQFDDRIRHAFEPDLDNIDLLANKKVILVKKYPKNDFQYRVYLKPHKIKDREDKETYLRWIDQNPDYNISPSVCKWFMVTDWNWDRRYMLVRNDSALLMLKLRNSDVVGSVYEYVISDK